MRYKLFTVIILQAAVIFLTAGQLFAQNKDTKESTGPDFSGYIRFWQQSDFSTDQSQFIAKEITMGATGTVNEYFGYKFLADFTRLGKLSTTSTTIDGNTVITKTSASFTDVLLDAMIKVTPAANLSISGGQFKIPFSTDNLRGNNSIAFVNRPFITSVAPASRDVGVMVSYKASSLLPEISAGIFNGSGLNKTENDKTINYVCRAVVSPLTNLNLSANYYAGRISALDVKAIGLGVDWKYENLFVDGEYVTKNTDQPGSTVGSNAFFVYSTYNISVSETGFVKYITPAVRFDSFDPDKDKNDNEVQRFTFGVTFNSATITWAHIRLNYEMYDYKDDTVNPDKLIAELQVRF